MGVELVPMEVREPEDLEPAFMRMKRATVGALLVLGEPLFYRHQRRINELSMQTRLACMWPTRQGAGSGGLMSREAWAPSPRTTGGRDGQSPARASNRLGHHGGTDGWSDAAHRHTTIPSWVGDPHVRPPVAVSYRSTVPKDRGVVFVAGARAVSHPRGAMVAQSAC
jgi:hypothetical protein